MKWILVIAVLSTSFGCSKGPAGYLLTSYKQNANARSVITLRHGSQKITAECMSFCNEYGTMVGQELNCFVEPPPSDPAHPYETKRPIFNATGGAFVCTTGRSKVFMVRHYECFVPPPRQNQRLEENYFEDRLSIPVDVLDKQLCKPGEQYRDAGGHSVTEDGTVLPNPHSVEWLNIVEVR